MSIVCLKFNFIINNLEENELKHVKIENKLTNLNSLF